MWFTVPVIQNSKSLTIVMTVPNVIKLFTDVSYKFSPQLGP
jgi:hypothetical protein